MCGSVADFLSGDGKKSQEYFVYFKIFFGAPAAPARWGEEEETERFSKALSRRALERERSFFRRSPDGKYAAKTCVTIYSEVP